MTTSAWRIDGAGVMLALRVTPRAGQGAVGGVRILPDGQNVMEARVRAAASDGAANDAVLRLLADRLGVPRRAVILKSGASSRLKRVRIEADAAKVVAILERLAGAE